MMNEKITSSRSWNFKTCQGISKQIMYIFKNFFNVFQVQVFSISHGLVGLNIYQVIKIPSLFKSVFSFFFRNERVQKKRSFPNTFIKRLRQFVNRYNHFYVKTLSKTLDYLYLQIVVAFNSILNIYRFLDHGLENNFLNQLPFLNLNE